MAIARLLLLLLTLRCLSSLRLLLCPPPLLLLLFPCAAVAPFPFLPLFVSLSSSPANRFSAVFSTMSTNISSIALLMSLSCSGDIIIIVVIVGIVVGGAATEL